MRFFWIGLLLISFAQAQTSYTVSFPNRVYHEAEVTATFTGLATTREAVIQMARSSPGRYALHEFAKNVYNVSATDGAGKALTLTRPDAYSWRAAGHDGTVIFRYTLFGNRADGTYAGITQDYAHLNMPAAFAYAPSLAAKPYSVVFRIPADVKEQWSVATQLPAAPNDMGGDSTWTAPDLQYFFDSPTIVGPILWREFKLASLAGNTGAQRTIRVALLDEKANELADQFAASVQKTVREQRAFFGALPSYDYGTYTFLCNYWDTAAGDGMEHRNSTVCSGPGDLASTMEGRLGTVSHEFIHGWNVERIRPQGLEPFDFTRTNLTDGLWLAEGFTSYLDDLFLTRAGLVSQEDYLAEVAGELGYFLPHPGRQYHNPIQMSHQAAFVDAAVRIDEVNYNNTYISYYTYGSVLGLGLDLEIRSQFAGKSIQDFFRSLWRRHPDVAKPYSMADAQAALAEVTNTAFAASFFQRYVYGREVPDYATLFQQMGLALVPANPTRAVWMWPGETRDTSRLQLAADPQVGTPLRKAGLAKGDIITRADGQPIRSIQQLRDLAASKQPGNTVAIEYTRGGLARTATVTLIADPALKLQAIANAPAAALDKRKDWLGSKVN